MHSDAAYLSQYPTMARLLIEASQGDFAAIPQHYLDHFHHEFANGDVSLVPALSKFVDADFVEPWQLDEAIELLSRVNREHWPDYDSIEAISVESLLSNEYDPEEKCSNFVEDNLGTSEKTQQVIKTVIESVFGKGVTTVRDRSGNYPSPSNHFLQDEDGTFSGTFKHENHVFSFEIAPTEQGWLCTYRLTEKSLDKLERPKYKASREKDKKSYRSVRNQAWR